MKKQIAVSAAILIAAGAISVNAADTKNDKINFLDILENMKEKCVTEENCKCKILDIIDILGNLPNVSLPDIDIDIPDISFPDFIIPEDKPEEDTPETEAPEENKPIIPEEKPETKPEEKPETDDEYVSESKLANEILTLVNEHRASAGLSSVTLDPKICNAANIRAKEIKTSFSHTRPSGKSCFTALSEVGVSYNGAGENIAYGQNSASEVMNAWMNSEGHRANILNGSFTKLGVGVYSSGGTLYFVQLFTY